MKTVVIAILVIYFRAKTRIYTLKIYLKKLQGARIVPFVRKQRITGKQLDMRNEIKYLFKEEVGMYITRILTSSNVQYH
jgi:hypothetical protein